MTDYISRETLENWVREEVASLDSKEDREFVIQRWRKEIPAADVAPVVRCKDCKHYEVDPFITMSGVPIIPAHHVCTFWAGGCMTNPDGYCFAGVKKEDTP